MQNFRILFSATIYIFLFSGFLSAQSFFSDNVEMYWQTEAVFKVPESVYHNMGDDMLYVSNINGKPTDKDGNGFISQLETDGRIVRLEWLTGLNAPKGMSVHEGKLYVSDIDRVAEIDIKKRKIIKFHKAEGAKFLNDVTTDKNGNIYISDMMTGAIYKISDGNISQWIPAETFEKSNGIYFLDGMIYLGAKGKIVSINPETKNITTLVEFEGSVDGLAIDKEGSFIFSDWSGKVQKVQAGSKPEVLFNTTNDQINAADIHLIRDKNILLVPTFYDMRVVAYKLVK